LINYLCAERSEAMPYACNNPWTRGSALPPHKSTRSRPDGCRNRPREPDKATGE